MNQNNLYRDYENVQRILKGGEFKISIKSLTKVLGCNLENRKQCGIIKKGACCVNHSKDHHTIYHPEEIEKLPADIKKFLNPDGSVRFEVNGHCKMIEACIKNPLIKPTCCGLAPLGFNKSGRLIIKRMAWLRPCPFYGKGEPIYIAMADCLKQTFGEKGYEKICYMIKNNIEG